MKLAEPEWLSRKDIDNGRWIVEECEAKRGIPATAITEKQMRVPVGNNDMERVIRAHEMMHAKVSPAGPEFDVWINRKIASKRGLIACEELRVNLLCQKAGFDMMSHLSDGGETADGERIAISGTWEDAVYSAIACAGTASQKKFLTGIRRHNRVWGKALLSICQRAVKQMQKQPYLADTRKHEGAGVSPMGFIYTEQLAEWIDRIAKTEAPDTEQKKDKKKKSTSSNEFEKSEESEESEDAPGAEDNSEEEDFLDKIKSIPPDLKNTVPFWAELKIERLPMPKQTRGNIGKKRTASNVGKSPRRLHRYMSDPEKRIFDKTSHGLGGVVVIDASGSMSLSQDDVRLLVEASPGATVIAYSYSGEENPNAWVLADKGRMVDTLPRMGNGNAVDFPAIEWAVKKKQRSNSPVIWVTDGGVCGPHQGYSERLAMQCINFSLKNRIIVLPNVQVAISELTKMQRGIKGTSSWPYQFRRTYRDKTKSELI
jgi:hypothetical protein